MKVDKYYTGRMPEGYLKVVVVIQVRSKQIFLYSHLINDFINLQYLSFEISGIKL